ncbi:pentapeptide repeat-containing protein [Millionella massiliensis]|uniref:pentapeptide repeat-containing protein n=1 Tax=Millionella massiliensis TaxID=1871023 RepID=UPI0023A7D4E5|nr:pentapeptide repeat-containing protein [Millionella massiliensis]
MERTRFTGSVLRECFFSGCDLAEADFSECDLKRTLFEHCRLEGADFRAAFAFTIDPAANRMRGARFSRGGLEGLLTQFGLRIEE